MNVTKEEIKQFLKDSIEWLVDQDMGCSTLKLDDRLAICVGWLDGYDENDEDLIHAKDGKSWCLNAGIKVYTSDDMRTDYEFINAPYYDNGEVISDDVSLKPDEDLDKLADYFIKEYANLEDLEIEEDGRVIEDNFDDAYEDSEDEEEVEVKEESLKEEKESVNGCSDVISAIKDALENDYLVETSKNILVVSADDCDYKFRFNKDCSVDLTNIDDIIEDQISWGYLKDTKAEKDDFKKSFKHFNSAEELVNSSLPIFLNATIELPKKLKSQEESLKESWEGENIIDDLVERAQSMYDDGGYGDIDDCVAQAIDDGLIYSDDILELAKHYGTLPDDSDLIAEFYDELSSDVYSGIEEHEDSDEDELEDETDESLKESKGNSNYSDVKVGDKVLYSKRKYNKRNEPKKEYFKGIVKEINGDTLKLEDDVVVYKEPKDEFDFRFEKIEEIKDPIKDVDIFKQGVDDLDDYQLLQKFRDAKNKYLTLKARQGGDAYPTKDMKRRVDKLKKKLLKRGITKESLESLKESNANNKYLDLEEMTIEDIRTAPVGWYWEGDGETVIKIDEDKVFLVANYIGDTVENYVKGMIDEFGSNAKLKDICDNDDYYENNLGIMSEDELEEYRDEWEDAYIGD